MFKEFKLIKKYPSLPKDWEEGMLVGLGDYPSYSSCDGKYSCRFLQKEEVENNPEYWEKSYSFVRLNGEIIPFGTTIYYFTFFDKFEMHSHVCDKDTSNFLLTSDFPMFATKKNAENWLIMNQPCLCINDIENIPTWDNLIEDLKQLVKTKNKMKLSENKKILIKQKIEQLLQDTTNEQSENLAYISLAKDKIFNYIVNLLETKTNK